MYICYLDEAGCTGQLQSASDSVQPTFTVVGLVIDSKHLSAVTHELLMLKQRFFPRKLDDYHTRQSQRHFLDIIQLEIKGSEIRKNAAARSRNTRRHAIGFLDKTLRLAENHNTKVLASSLVKGLGEPINSRALYTNSVQSICESFNAYLVSVNSAGLVIADSRNPHLNKMVAHSIFTQKYRADGDAYPNILEMPVFGHSDNHAGLQLSDLIASAFITPAIIDYYCKGVVYNSHVRHRYSTLRTRYIGALQAMQYRFCNQFGYWRGGIHVSDKLLNRKTGSFLRESS